MEREENVLMVTGWAGKVNVFSPEKIPSQKPTGLPITIMGQCLVAACSLFGNIVAVVFPVELASGNLSNVL